ncbi:MAG: S41 family peptidase [Gemmatimonas sp.]
MRPSRDLARGPRVHSLFTTRNASYTTGFLEYLPPGAHGLPSAGVAFGPARYHYDEGTWSGPLVLLVDRHTASASEDFMVALKDQGAARVIGERTYGAGCGYTDGGIGFVLAHSELLVTMPDCARIRLNGKNEVSGIEVDLEVKRDATLILDAVTLIVRGRLAPSAPDP